jgi:hypothetical protein
MEGSDMYSSSIFCLRKAYIGLQLWDASMLVTKYEEESEHIRDVLKPFNWDPNHSPPANL